MISCRTTKPPSTAMIRSSVELIHQAVNDPDAHVTWTEVATAVGVIRLAAQTCGDPVSRWLRGYLAAQEAGAGPIALRAAVNTLAQNFKIPPARAMTRPLPGQQGELF